MARKQNVRNGSAAKLQRQVNADAIKVQSEVYPCEHLHISPEQAKRCPNLRVAAMLKHL